MPLGNTNDMPSYRTGGEIDSLCGKCKMTLAHTILAMVGDKVVRVQCNTCGSQHNFKAPPGSSETASRPRASASASGGTSRSGGASGSGSGSAAKASAAVTKITMSFEQLMSQKHLGPAKRYSPKDTYVVDDVIDHPSFGFGIVTGARGDKVDVLFKMAEKTLVHGRGGAPAAKPVFDRPKSTVTGPADKPMSAQTSAGASGAASASGGAGGAGLDAGAESPTGASDPAAE